MVLSTLFALWIMGKEMYSATWTQEGNVEPRNVPTLVSFIFILLFFYKI